MYEWQRIGFWSAPIPMVVINPVHNRLLTANSQACRFLRIDLPQFQRQNASSLFRTCLPQLIALTDEAMEMGRAWSESMYLSFPTSEEKARIELCMYCHWVEQETILTLTFQDADQLAIQRDRSDAQHHYRSGLGHWQRMTKVFQEFEHENRLLLDAAGEGIYGVDANGLTTFVNPAAERILGWNANELIGKNMHSLIHANHADGSDFHVADCPIYQAFKEGIIRHVDGDIFWTQSGKPIDVEYSSTPIKDNGHVVGAVIVFRDVTEKKLAQQQLLTALEEVESLKQRLELENAYLQEELNSEFNHHQIIGKSNAIQNVLQKIELVAPTNVTVLVTGESGTGKELIARAIHEFSDRSKRSLIRVNCAAIPSELFESEFFGHAKGSFTGATSDRPGRFELADGGTLFLDEVGEIPLVLQGKLLRVLQEQQFERVGESKTRNVDVRIITATNKDLKALVQQGEFREDLYFRLNVFPIESAPLRQRVEDIPMLAQHFIKKASMRANKSGLKISLGQLENLKHYHWPGNIRELENIIERQVILSQDGTLRFDDLVNHYQKTPMAVSFAANEVLASEDSLKLQQKKNVILALQQTNGKVFGEGGAAELLGIKPTTLSSRIKKYNIERKLYVKP